MQTVKTSYVYIYILSSQALRGLPRALVPRTVPRQLFFQTVSGFQIKSNQIYFAQEQYTIYKWNKSSEQEQQG